MGKGEGKAPAFQLYASDLLTDVMDWTDEQVGAHMRLLCWSWVNRRGIPRDTQRLLRIAPAAERAWSVIGEKWVEGPDDTWINNKLEETRADSDAFRARQKEKSALAVTAREKKGIKGGRRKKPVGKPIGQPSDTSNDEPVGDPLEGEGEGTVLNNGEGTRAPELTNFRGIAMPFTSERFAKAWNEWLAYRKKRRLDYANTESEQRQVNLLKPFDEEFAIGLLEKAIDQKYQGFVFDDTLERYQKRKTGSGAPPPPMERNAEIEMDLRSRKAS